jgi:GTPase SAR1 family protein
LSHFLFLFSIAYPAGCSLVDHGDDKLRKAQRIKVVSTGPTGVGKSCLIKRFCEQRFVPRYIQTIGVDYGVKAVKLRRHLGEETVLKINFFDLSGAAAFKEIRKNFLQDTQVDDADADDDDDDDIDDDDDDDIDDDDDVVFNFRVCY